MALVHPRGMNALVPQNAMNNSTSLTNLTYNVTASTNLLSGAPSRSRFIRQTRNYVTSQKLAREKEFLDREEESELKVAKYLAIHHPDFYWSRYIEKFKRGSGEIEGILFIYIDE